MASLMAWWTVSAVVMAALAASGQATSSKPNIILMLADDMGWADSGLVDKTMRTPMMNKLAREGCQLLYNYVMPTCAPTRSALLTGKYPYTFGMQVNPISGTKLAWMDHTLTLLPEKMKDLGYSTHMIGKWHLGFCNKSLTPTGRGFDTFYGFYSGAQGFFNHSGNNNNSYDFRDNDEIVWDAKGKYSTHLHTARAQKIIRRAKGPFFMYLSYQNVHGPFEAKYSDMKKCDHVTPLGRQIHCAMTLALDRSIRKIVNTLEKTNKMKNTIISFMSDNGGPLYGHSYNYPLRGQKATLWEGGTRVNAFLYSPLLNKPKCEYHGMIHAVDWFPTLVQAAGGSTAGMGLDGIPMWEQLRTNNPNLPNTRTSFIYNIDDDNDRKAIRMGRYKLILGKPGRKYNGWYPPPGLKLKTTHVRAIEKEHLYDIENDPYEEMNLYKNTSLADTIKKMTAALEEAEKRLRPYQDSIKSKLGHKIMMDTGAYAPGWCDPDTCGFWQNYACEIE